MNKCTTHHICDCYSEKLEELKRRLREAVHYLKYAGYFIIPDHIGYAQFLLNKADELEAPPEEKMLSAISEEEV